MKSFIYLLIIVVTLSSCFYRGHKSDTTSSTRGNNVDTVFIGFSADAHDQLIFQPIIDEFNAQHADIQVQFVDANRDLSRNDQLRIADTSVVIHLDESDYPSGYLLDLNPLIQADPSFDKADYYDGIFERVGKEERIYGIPYLIQLPMLHFNRDVFAANGIQVADDWSWNDFLAVIQNTSTHTGSDSNVYGFLDESIGANILLAALNAEESQVLYSSVSGRPHEIQGRDVANAVEEVLLLYDDDAFYTREQANIDGTGLEELIQDGRVAMWPTYMLSHEQNVGTDSIPIGTLIYPHSSVPSITPGYNFVISAGTQHPAEAWRWISFLSKHYLAGLNVPMSDIRWSPARRTVREAFIADTELNESDIAMQQQLLNRPHHRDIRPFNTAAVNYIRQAMDNMLQENISIEQALQEAQAEFDTYYATMQQEPTQTPNPVIVVPTLVPNDTPPQDAIVVNFSWTEGEQHKSLIDSFNDRNRDIFVQLVSLAPEQPESIASVAQNVDCFVRNAVPTREDTASLLNIEPLISGDASFNKDDYLTSVQQLYRIDGKYYGIPLAFTPQKILYYNYCGNKVFWFFLPYPRKRVSSVSQQRFPPARV